MLRPISVAKAQNSICIVAAVMRLAPKLIANTIASGDRMITQGRIPPPWNTCAAMPLSAKSMAMMPVSSTPEAM
jgi:hypothetical protein